MTDKAKIDDLERRLNEKDIHAVRKIARLIGVAGPSEGKKSRLIEEILKIACGDSDPVPPPVRGARPKSNDYDRQLVADLLKCREISLSSVESESDNNDELTVSVNGLSGDPLDFSAMGILEKSDDKWFVRVNGFGDNIYSDIYVNNTFIERYNLREGDLVECNAKRNSLNEIAGLVSLITVNGMSPRSLASRKNFDSMTPVYSDRRLKTASYDNITGRMIDYFAPLGAGQRALIFYPKTASKTAVLKDLAKGVSLNDPAVKIILLLIDSRPEEAADYRRSFPDADVFISGIEMSGNCHIRTARLVLEYAKRQTEISGAVVLVVDDLTRLTRAYNSCGGQVLNSLDISAIEFAKKFFAAARKTEDGASLTILSALSYGEGDAVNEAIYSELKDLANMKVTLSDELVQIRVYPPVDIRLTGTSGDERLLTNSELKIADRLRSIAKSYGTAKIIELFTDTHTEEELNRKLSEIIL